VTVSSGAADNRPAGDFTPADRDLMRKVHLTIRKVTDDIDRFHFNTAVSAIMELANAMQSYREAHGTQTAAYSEAAGTILLLLAPMAPHISAELWDASGGEGDLHRQPWPSFNADLAASDVVEVAVQVNGKVRDRLTLPADVSEDEAIKAALGSERVQAMLDGKQVRNARYVPGRLVSLVI
jgi:leucyl-tRNA synthetase